VPRGSAIALKLARRFLPAMSARPASVPSARSGRRRFSAALLAVPLLAAMLAGCDSRRAAPEFSYTLLDGTPGSSAQLRGKVVLVNFWATSCVSCVKEMPALVETHEKFRARGFETLAVAMSYDPPAFVANFARTRNLPFGVVIDNTGAIAQGFGDVQLTPTTFLIDKRGRIVKRYVGEPDFAALHRLVDRLLGEA
jgi:peroxiredoxin